MTRSVSKLLVIALILLAVAPVAKAEEYKPDDRVIFDVAAEDWVNTKTARVTVNVEASVSGNTAGTTRASMMKALESLSKTDWRLVSFGRSEDSTGLERWSAMFEARIPENEMSGIHQNAKKVSKPGMQLVVSGIDFSPTLEEVQTALAQLRTRIYKMANEQLAALNTAISGRTYRIAMIDFAPNPYVNGTMMENTPSMQPMRAAKSMMPEDMSTPYGASPAPMERSEKLTLTARIVYAAIPPQASK